MATEKILIFDEAGNAKRMKVRIARFLDNEPVTASDKENIRTTLDVDGSQSGTFTTPLSVTSASDSSFTGGGKVGIGGSPGYELDVQAANARIAATSGAGVVNHLQADATGAWVGPLSNHDLYFKTNNTIRWTINTSGNLVASSGKGIDFSSTSDGSGTMSSELLDDYEEGTWSPAFAMTGGDFTTAPTMDIISARYVKVGHMVTFYAYLRTDSVDITGAGGSLAVEGLPYANAGSNNYAAINVGQANFWTNAPSGGYVYSGGDYIVLTKRNTGITGSMTEMTAADLTAGVTANQNQLMISGSYFSF